VRILVYPASTDLGGSQLNAIDLAHQMQQRGHHVVVFGPDGPLRPGIEAAGLPFVVAPRPGLRPTGRLMRALCDTVAQHGIDVVHGYEWPPILESVYGPYLRQGTAVIGTVMSMGVAPFIPTHLPLVVGTEHIAATERRRRPDVRLIEPPIDTTANAPSPDGGAARAQLNVEADDFLVVMVSRLAKELKRQGILEAVRAAGQLSDELPLRLLIVGDGPARDEVQRAAADVNTGAGRRVVTLTGAVLDPRSCYSAADVSLGMGSSALRAMAFGKPVVVQGERGFWELLTPHSVDTFLYQGWYGVGSGGDGTRRVAAILRHLYHHPAERAQLGEYARSLVVDRFSLGRAADIQEQLYRDAVASNPKRRTAALRLVRPLGDVAAYHLRRRYAARRGTAAADDFNALPVQSGSAPTR
jgi:glycosyltransferase involved in cell wall biosynthesis